MKKYIIWAPQYAKSNGIRVLYKLAQQLEQKGYEAYIWCEAETCKDVKYIKKITDENRKNDIVVYPEIVLGNPLEFQNVARWILYFPGKLGGSKEYDDYEVPFVFGRVYYPKGDILLIDTLDRKLFYKDDTIKDTDCYFVYKKGKWREIPKFENMTEITYDYPKTREELAQLLRRTKTLYTYDDHTILADEAALCGCDVKIVRENGFEDFHIQEDKIDYEGQLDNFIKKTQQMNYKGKIRKKPAISKLFYKKYYLKYLLYKYILRNEQKALTNLKKYCFCNSIILDVTTLKTKPMGGGGQSDFVIRDFVRSILDKTDFIYNIWLNINSRESIFNRIYCTALTKGVQYA